MFGCYDHDRKKAALPNFKGLLYEMWKNDARHKWIKEFLTSLHLFSVSIRL